MPFPYFLFHFQEVVLMGWVHEQMPSAAHTKVWQRKVLVLRKLQLQIFPSALVTIYILIPSPPPNFCMEKLGLGMRLANIATFYV